MSKLLSAYQLSFFFLCSSVAVFIPLVVLMVWFRRSLLFNVPSNLKMQAYSMRKWRTRRTLYESMAFQSVFCCAFLPFSFLFAMFDLSSIVHVSQYFPVILAQFPLITELIVEKLQYYNLIKSTHRIYHFKVKTVVFFVWCFVFIRELEWRKFGSRD